MFPTWKMHHTILFALC